MEYKCSDCGALFINDSQERRHYNPDGLCPTSPYKKEKEKEVIRKMPELVSGGMTVQEDQTLEEFLDKSWESYGISVLEKVNKHAAVVAVNGTFVHLRGPLGGAVSVSSGDEVFVLSVIAGG